MTPMEISDATVLDLLRKQGPLSVSELVEAQDVTATAVRQRLNRLMGQGLIARVTTRHGRGRPIHRYSLTEKARKQAGNNFGDLAQVLWEEIRAVKDPEVRRGLLERLASRLADTYADQVRGTGKARLDSMQELFAERRVPIEVREVGGLPQLKVLDCPYPELAEKDRGICAVEKMLFSELLDSPLKLTECRLDGHACCQFQTSAQPDIVTGLPS
jgi:predicted ArsR family transcriptional regulator